MRVEFFSFDGTEICGGPLMAPDRSRDLHALLGGPGPFAALGAGLSYCQAAAGDRVTPISTPEFGRGNSTSTQNIYRTIVDLIHRDRRVDSARYERPGGEPERKLVSQASIR
jgi:hypothetical protein